MPWGQWHECYGMIGLYITHSRAKQPWLLADLMLVNCLAQRLTGANLWVQCDESDTFATVSPPTHNSMAFASA